MTDRAFDAVPDWAKLQAATAPIVKRSMPTDEQLEPIARRYCELMGEDPDERVTLPSPPAPKEPPPVTPGCFGGYWAGLIVRGPRWKLALPIVRQHATLSIAFGGK
jgi:hypothetical protein